MVAQTQRSYKLVEGWEKIPPGYTHLDVVGIAVDPRDRVYILTRFEPRVMVYERDGTFVKSFAEGVFTPRTHGLAIDAAGALYCVDDGDHTVRKFSSGGQLLMTIGTPGKASDSGYDASVGIPSIVRGAPPFNRCTDIAIAPSGNLYVSDGYGNARVHRFTADGKLIQSWGEPGNGPGQFNLPHAIAVTADGRVWVADRENDRLQIFSPEGKFLDQWTNVQRPCGLHIDRDGLVYVGELWWRVGQRSFVHGETTVDKPGRATVLAPNGKILARWGGPDRAAPGNFVAPHCICSDSRGDVYVGEVTYTFAARPGLGLVPPDTHTFQKFALDRTA